MDQLQVVMAHVQDHVQGMMAQFLDQFRAMLETQAQAIMAEVETQAKLVIADARAQAQTIIAQSRQNESPQASQPSASDHNNDASVQSSFHDQETLFNRRQAKFHQIRASYCRKQALDPRHTASCQQQASFHDREGMRYISLLSLGSSSNTNPTPNSSFPLVAVQAQPTAPISTPTPNTSSVVTTEIGQHITNIPIPAAEVSVPVVQSKPKPKVKRSKPSKAKATTAIAKPDTEVLVPVVPVQTEPAPPIASKAPSTLPTPTARTQVPAEPSLAANVSPPPSVGIVSKEVAQVTGPDSSTSVDDKLSRVAEQPLPVVNPLSIAENQAAAAEQPLPVLFTGPSFTKTFDDNPDSDSDGDEVLSSCLTSWPKIRHPANPSSASDPVPEDEVAGLVNSTSGLAIGKKVVPAMKEGEPVESAQAAIEETGNMNEDGDYLILDAPDAVEQSAEDPDNDDDDALFNDMIINGAPINPTAVTVAVDNHASSDGESATEWETVPLDPVAPAVSTPLSSAETFGPSVQSAAAPLGPAAESQVEQSQPVDAFEDIQIDVEAPPLSSAETSQPLVESAAAPSEPAIESQVGIFQPVDAFEDIEVDVEAPVDDEPTYPLAVVADAPSSEVEAVPSAEAAHLDAPMADVAEPIFHFNPIRQSELPEPVDQDMAEGGELNLQLQPLTSFGATTPLTFSVSSPSSTSAAAVECELGAVQRLRRKYNETVERQQAESKAKAKAEGERLAKEEEQRREKDELDQGWLNREHAKNQLEEWAEPEVVRSPFRTPRIKPTSQPANAAASSQVQLAQPSAESSFLDMCMTAAQSAPLPRHAPRAPLPRAATPPAQISESESGPASPDSPLPVVPNYLYSEVELYRRTLEIEHPLGNPIRIHRAERQWEIAKKRLQEHQDAVAAKIAKNNERKAQATAAASAASVAKAAAEVEKQREEAAKAAKLAKDKEISDRLWEERKKNTTEEQMAARYNRSRVDDVQVRESRVEQGEGMAAPAQATSVPSPRKLLKPRSQQQKAIRLEGEAVVKKAKKAAHYEENKAFYDPQPGAESDFPEDFDADHARQEQRFKEKADKEQAEAARELRRKAKGKMKATDEMGPSDLQIDPSLMLAHEVAQRPGIRVGELPDDFDFLKEAFEAEPELADQVEHPTDQAGFDAMDMQTAIRNSTVSNRAEEAARAPYNGESSSSAALNP